ncbi:hypothetical protein CDD83_5852 [Cordyceps sp. RAO-2017]|nr:hypothetical protein CDD83_5852 [Cordyceps sp. RAO-2017]
MKFTAAAVLLASVAYATQGTNMETEGRYRGGAFDFDGLIGKLGPLGQKALCAGPCVAEVANKLKCGGKGLVDTACENIDNIKRRSEPCLKKCRIEPRFIEIGHQAAHWACNKRHEHGGESYRG